MAAEAEGSVDQQRAALVVRRQQRADQGAHPAGVGNRHRDLLDPVTVDASSYEPPPIQLDRAERLVQAGRGERRRDDPRHRHGAAVLDPVAELARGRAIEVRDEQLDVGIGVANHQRHAQRERIVVGNDHRPLDSATLEDLRDLALARLHEPNHLRVECVECAAYLVGQIAFAQQKYRRGGHPASVAAR